MKGQFKRCKGDNVWYLIIFGDADVLRKIANIWKSIRTKIQENTGGIVQYDKNCMRIKFESNDNLATDNIVNMHNIVNMLQLLEVFLLKMINFILSYFQMIHFMNYNNVSISKN